jgi:hypothetical protein
MNDLTNTRYHSLKKTINVKELYIEKDFKSAPSCKNSINFQFSNKIPRCPSRSSKFRFGHSRSPFLAETPKDSLLVIQTIQSPTDLKPSQVKSSKKSYTDYLSRKSKFGLLDLSVLSSKPKKEDFFTKAFKTSKVKFSSSLVPKRPNSILKPGKVSPKRLNLETGNNPLSGWET